MFVQVQVRVETSEPPDPTLSVRGAGARLVEGVVSS